MKAVVKGIESYDDGDWQGVAEEMMKQIIKNAAKDNKILGIVLDELGLLDDSGGGSKESKVDDTANAQNATNGVKQQRDNAHAGELDAVKAEIAATQAELDGLNKPANPPTNNPPPPAGSEARKTGRRGQEKGKNVKNQQIEFLEG